MEVGSEGGPGEDEEGVEGLAHAQYSPTFSTHAQYSPTLRSSSPARGLSVWWR